MAKIFKTPIILSLVIAALDQISKIYIDKLVYLNNYKIVKFGIYITNKNIRVNIYNNYIVNFIVQVFLPIILALGVSFVLLKKNFFSKLQQFFLWIMITVTISCRMELLFKKFIIKKIFMVKWLPFVPLFNIADFTVVLCGIFMILSLIKEKE